MPVLEKDIQKSILEYLELRGIFHYRNNSGAFKNDRGGFYKFGTTGSPDIVAVIRGKYCALEIKRPGGKLSPGQELFRDNLEKHGGIYWVFDSVEGAVSTIEQYLGLS